MVSVICPVLPCLNLFKVILGQPCDEDSCYLAPGVPSPLRDAGHDLDDWTPYQNWVEFKAAHFLYCQTQMSAPNINTLLDLWAATLLKHGDAPQFANAPDLYNTIDSMLLGDVPWQIFSLTYNGELPDGPAPPWMMSEYDVWFWDPHIIVKNMISSPNYINHFDVASICNFDSNGE